MNTASGSALIVLNARIADQHYSTISAAILVNFPIFATYATKALIRNRLSISICKPVILQNSKPSKLPKKIAQNTSAHLMAAIIHQSLKVIAVSML
jgi:hypothetical protein